MEDTGSRDELCWGSSELKCVAVWGEEHSGLSEYKLPSLYLLLQ